MSIQIEEGRAYEDANGKISRVTKSDLDAEGRKVFWVEDADTGKGGRWVYPNGTPKFSGSSLVRSADKVEWGEWKILRVGRELAPDSAGCWKSLDEGHLAYRVRKEPVRETYHHYVRLCGYETSIAVDFIDGKPDWSTIRAEANP